MKSKARSKQPPHEAFALELRRQRKRFNLTQLALATRLGMQDASYISNLETRHRIHSREIVVALAEAIGLGSYNTNRLLASAGFLPTELDNDWPIMMQKCMNDFLKISNQ